MLLLPYFQNLQNLFKSVHDFNTVVLSLPERIFDGKQPMATPHAEVPPDSKYRVLFLARIYMAVIGFPSHD